MAKLKLRCRTCDGLRGTPVVGVVFVGVVFVGVVFGGVALMVGCGETTSRATTQSDVLAQSDAAPPPPPAVSAPPPPPPVQEATTTTLAPKHHSDTPSNPTPETANRGFTDDSPKKVASGDSESDKPLNPSPNKPAVERVAAQPGVGIKGRSLDNEEGVLVRSAKTYFSVREKAIFQIRIPQAMQLFRGLNGRLPSSHEEFMSKIIKANRIKLPELPATHRYIYDPEGGELMVERPKR